MAARGHAAEANTSAGHRWTLGRSLGDPELEEEEEAQQTECPVE